MPIVHLSALLRATRDLRPSSLITRLASAGVAVEHGRVTDFLGERGRRGDLRRRQGRRIDGAPVRHKASGRLEIARVAATLPPTARRGLNVCAASAQASAVRSPVSARASIWAMAARGFVVAATEPAGPALPLRERVSRLFAGHEQPLAVFAPDGTLPACDDGRAGAARRHADLVGARHCRSGGAGACRRRRQRRDTSVRSLSSVSAAMRDRPRRRLRRKLAARAKRARPPHFTRLPHNRRTPPRRDRPPNGGIRCVSSGRWMPTAASWSARTSSSN